MLKSILAPPLGLFAAVACTLSASGLAGAFDDKSETVAESENEAATLWLLEEGTDLDLTFSSVGALYASAGASSLGVDVAPISAALRAQLGLREDRGVVVTNVEPDGPGDQAGIHLHDVLLSAGGEPVNDSAILQERIDAAGEEALSVILMRSGRRMSLEVTPQSRVYNDLTLAITQSYWIGIVAADADDALREQLGLPDGQGLVVTEIYDEMAADEAGIEVHDVLLEFGDKPLSAVEDLNSQIQEVADGEATVKLVRGGDVLNLKITPRLRDSSGELLWLFDDSNSYEDLATRYFTDLLNNGDGTFVEVGDATADLETDTTEQKLEDLIREMRDLTERMRVLQQLIEQPGANEGGDELEGAGEAK